MTTAQTKLTGPVKVLIVSPVAFIPDGQGSRRRVDQIVTMMKEFEFEVHFLFVRRDDQYDADARAMAESLNGKFTELADMKEASMSMPWFFQARVASKLGFYRFCNIHVDAWYFDEIGLAVRNQVHREHIDIVIVEYPFYSKVLGEMSGVVKVIDMHDVFTDRYKEFLRNGQRPFPWYSVTQTGEQTAINRADIVIAIQQGDAEIFRSYGHPAVQTLSYAPNPMQKARTSSSAKLKMCFLGTGNFFNIRALEHYLEHIHPALLAAGITFEFVVIGAVCESFRSLRLEGEIRLLGKVDDLEAELQHCDALVNSLSSGTGLPIKVMDALASGLHVLATDAGARGVPLRHQLRSINVCAGEQDWIDAVRRLAKMKHDGINLSAMALSDLATIQNEIDDAKRNLYASLLGRLKALGRDREVSVNPE